MVSGLKHFIEELVANNFDKLEEAILYFQPFQFLFKDQEKLQLELQQN